MKQLLRRLWYVIRQRRLEADLAEEKVTHRPHWRVAALPAQEKAAGL